MAAVFLILENNGSAHFAFLTELKTVL